MSHNQGRPGRRISARDGHTIRIAENQSIDGGVIAPLENFMRWTLYIQSSDAITITIALSPDGGENFVPMAEGPIVFNAPSRTIICGMDATHIALVGSNPAPINAWVRGIF